MAVKKKKAKKAKKATRRPAKKAAKRGGRKAKPVELIISKSRTKKAVDCKVASDFYAALDAHVRDLLAKAEDRAGANKRATLRPQDL